MVDETIQWARESLQRRRRELQQTKKNLVESYIADNDENDVDDTHYNSSPTQQQKAAHLLERGRALLAEAEAHSEILVQYASSGSSGAIVENQDSKYTDDSRNQHDHDHEE